MFKIFQSQKKEENASVRVFIFNQLKLINSHLFIQLMKTQIILIVTLDESNIIEDRQQRSKKFKKSYKM